MHLPENKVESIDIGIFIKNRLKRVLPDGQNQFKEIVLFYHVNPRYAFNRIAEYFHKIEKILINGFRQIEENLLKVSFTVSLCMGYEIFIPAWQVDLLVEPFNKKQEMIFGTLNYWEGGIKVAGKLNNKKVKGVGFMEIVGTPMKKSALKVYLNKFKKEMTNRPWQKLSQEISAKFKAYK